MKPVDLNELFKIKDHVSDLEKCVQLLYLLHLNEGPLAEVITVIKYEKPLLYSLLKQRIKHKPGLRMLFDVNFNYEKARKSVCDAVSLNL